MKRWIAVILMMLVLMQALPLNALATIGNVLTEDELNAAYALTGFGESRTQSNTTYHRGMQPNVRWNAMQFSDWLEDVLDVDIKNVTDILSRASNTLTELKDKDPEAYERFAKASYDGVTVIERLQGLTLEAEILREELSYQQDRLREDTAAITEMGQRIREEGRDLFASDVVRLSSKVEEAAADLKAAREEITAQSERWTKQIEYWNDTLALIHGSGGIDPSSVDYHLSEWLGDLFSGGQQPVTNAASVSVVKADGSRLSRIASRAGDLQGNDSQATVTVLSENQIAIRLIAGENKQGVEGVTVRVTDKRNPKKSQRTYTTDKNGTVVMESNAFIADSEKQVHLGLDVEAQERNYRSFGVNEITVKLGQKWEAFLTPLDAGPYIYSATFNGHDIIYQDWEMLFSTINDWKCDIVVVTRQSIGGDTPELDFYYPSGVNAGGIGKWKMVKADKPARKGNTFTWRASWKQLIQPRMESDMEPYFLFKGSEVKAKTRLVSVRGAVDKPITEGLQASVFGKSLKLPEFGLNFTIPGIDVKVNLNVPLPVFWPKVTYSPTGYLAIAVGSSVMPDDVNQDINWQSKDLKEMREVEKAFEQKSWLANAKTKYQVAWEYYTQKGFHFIAESKIDVGLFAIASGHKTLDNREKNVMAEDWSLRLNAGVVVSYAFEMTLCYTVVVVPLYMTIEIGASVGFAMGGEVRLLWRDGKFKDWKFIPLKDITITIAFSFGLTLGLGVKGVCSVWAKLSASLNFLVRFVITGADATTTTVGYSMGLTAGVELLFLKASKTIWPGKSGQLWPPQDNSANLLDSYMNADGGEEAATTSQIPDSYPQLAPVAKKLLTAENKARCGIKTVTLNGHTYVFYLAQTQSKRDLGTIWRVAWLDQTTGESGTIEDALERQMGTGNQRLTRITRYALNRQDFGMDVIAADGFIFLVAVGAKEYDADGLPKPNYTRRGNASSEDNIMPYAMVLAQDGKGRLTNRIEPKQKQEGASEASNFWFYCGLPISSIGIDPASEYYDTMSEPVVTWAKVFWENNNSTSGRIHHVEVNGSFGRVGYPTVNADGTRTIKAPTGGTFFRFNGTTATFYSDRCVKEPMGPGYGRYGLRPALRPVLPDSVAAEVVQGSLSANWIALSKPKDDASGQRAIEMFDYDMNDTGWNNTADGELVPLVLEKGDIRHVEVLNVPADSQGNRYSRRVFYTRKETKGDVMRYRLSGMTIDPVRSDNYKARAKTVEYPVTRYDYDIVLPTEEFSVTQINGMPYLYWLTCVGDQKKQSDPVVWRVNAVAYDPATNTLTDPSVFAEFTLPEGGSAIPQSVTLTAQGVGYICALPYTPETTETRTLSAMTLYSFPMRFMPVLTLKSVVLENGTACVGDFLDATVVMMNEGNMGVSSFDLELYTKDDGRESVVETVHVDCLHPEKSTLTAQVGNRQVTLPQGKRAAYRNDDLDYAVRKHDWMVRQEGKVYKFDVGDKKKYGPAGVDQGKSSVGHIKTDMMMPGAIAAFTVALRIPEGWSGKKTFWLRVKKVTSTANWVGAMANAAGVLADPGQPTANAAATDELCWTLDDSGERLVLEQSGAKSNAAASGLFANDIRVESNAKLDTKVHDIDISYRLYDDYADNEMLDIIIRNGAHTLDRFKLTCAVYLDGAEEPYYVNLPYYDTQISNDMTQTITLPVSALVANPGEHSSAVVVISAVNREETALINNEFTLFLAGSEEEDEEDLVIEDQPEDITVQEGEDVYVPIKVQGGVKPYKYQWQVWDPRKEKWVDLPGFTGPVLSREDVEDKWDGCRFRCVVTDAEGTQVVSKEFTLTVRDKVPTGDNSHLPLYLLIAMAALALLWWMRRLSRA